MAEKKEYNHEEAKAKRDEALGLAFEQGLATGTSFNVYHKEGEYKVRCDSEHMAAIVDDWLFVAQVTP